MKNLTIVSANHKSITYVAENNDTLADILSQDDVCNFFDADPEDIQEALIQCGDAELGSVALQRLALQAAPEDGDIIVIDLDVEEDIEEAEEGEDADASTTSAQTTSRVGGIVTVYAAGGLKVDLDITPGMTVTQAAHHETVQLRTHQTLAQLSNCPISVNGVPVTQTNANERPVNPGDVITMSPPANAGTKGQNNK